MGIDISYGALYDPKSTRVESNEISSRYSILIAEAWAYTKDIFKMITIQSFYRDYILPFNPYFFKN